MLSPSVSRAGAVEPSGRTIESINPDTGALVAQDAKGETVVIDKGILGSLQPGRVISVDAEKGTILALVSVPFRAQGAGGGEVQATANAASAASGAAMAGPKSI